MTYDHDDYIDHLRAAKKQVEKDQLGVSWHSDIWFRYQRRIDSLAVELDTAIHDIPFHNAYAEWKSTRRGMVSFLFILYGCGYLGLIALNHDYLVSWWWYPACIAVPILATWFTIWFLHTERPWPADYTDNEEEDVA